MLPLKEEFGSEQFNISLEELLALCRLHDGLPRLLILREHLESVPQERRLHPVRRQGDDSDTGAVQVEVSLKCDQF